MIDTIKIAIPIDGQPSWPRAGFRPSLSMLNHCNDYFKATRNPLIVEKKQNIYMPRLTFIQRITHDSNVSRELQIEVSLPKLMFGNNFDEITEKMMDGVANKITELLDGIGISISLGQIKNASIRRIDFCKNIILKNYTSVNSVLKNIEMANISEIYDVSKSDFRNGGSIIHYHCNSLDVVIYDKIADLRQSKKSEKRSVEMDNFIQQDLLSILEKEKRRSVIRFEVRLNGAKKIKEALKAAGFADIPEVNFTQIFKKEIARKILLFYWNNIVECIPKIPLDSDKPEIMLAEILKGEKVTPMLALARFGCLYLIKNTDERYLKKVFKERFYRDAWPRLKKKVGGLLDKTQLVTLLYIGRCIEDMEAIRLGDIGVD